MMCAGGPVSWHYKTQKCVTLSTTQAEYVAMSGMGKEVLFLRQVWCFMLPKARMPCIAMYEDNEGAILFVVLRNMTEMIRFILGSSIYRGIMCISKLAVDWWKLVGIRRLISGYFSGLATYWMMLFMPVSYTHLTLPTKA